MSIAIDTRGISKRFRINHAEMANGKRIRKSFGESLAHRASLLVRNLRSGAALGNVEEFWALRDVSFSIPEGEVVGIIGPNGAGKSTLLKILARISTPTMGEARLRGRLGSLLEVGTGFHPELTGRDNVYLSGSILGMSRRQIDASFDQIVDFSGVEKFIDTPVKRYSSGMKVRLGFAVAAHLDLEIMLVDEVLAVGDANFQRKCFDKVNDVAKSGRTIIFVSHNMVAMRTLCQRLICLKGGEVVDDGDSADVIQRYMEQVVGITASSEMDLSSWPRKGIGGAKIVHARLVSHDGTRSGKFYRLRPMALEFTFESTCPIELNLSAVCMTCDDMVKVLHLDHHDTPGFNPGIVNGRRTVRVQIDSLPLHSGEFQWALGIHARTSQTIIDLVYDVLPFFVEDDLRISPRPYRSTSQSALCTLAAHWSFVDPDASPTSLDHDPRALSADRTN